MEIYWPLAASMLAALPAPATAGPDPEPSVPPARSLWAAGASETPSSILASEEGAFRVYFKDNLRFEAGDGSFSAKLGGRLQHDWAWFSEDVEEAGLGDFENGVEVRRARLYLSGELLERYEFKLQYDFAGGDVSFKDVYAGVRFSDCLRFRVGQQYEPVGLEEQTSSNYISFAERALPSGIAPARSTGALLFGNPCSERLYYGVGIFQEDSDDDGNGLGGSGAWSYGGRITGLPFHDEETGDLVHLGASASWRSTFDRDADGVDDFQERFRPSAHLAPRLIDSGVVMADESTLYGVEAAGIFGSWWVHGEYLTHEADATDGMSDPEVSGYYLATGYYLTGERRGYKTSGGVFDKTRVRSPFGVDGGLGAFEVAARYSMVEIENVRVGAGGDDELSDITLGLNWYLHTNVRVQFNVVDFDVDSEANNVDEDGRAFVTRFHIWL